MKDFAILDIAFLCGVILVPIFIVGGAIIGLYKKDVLQHECIIEMSKQNRSADDITKICGK